MLINCPHCGETIQVSSSGRKPLNVPVIFICDALELHKNVTTAAGKLGCSRGYIYKTLKACGLKPEEVIKGKTDVKREGNRGEGG